MTEESIQFNDPLSSGKILWESNDEVFPSEIAVTTGPEARLIHSTNLCKKNRRHDSRLARAPNCEYVQDVQVMKKGDYLDMETSQLHNEEIAPLQRKTPHHNVFGGQWVFS